MVLLLLILLILLLLLLLLRLLTWPTCCRCSFCGCCGCCRNQIFIRRVVGVARRDGDKEARNEQRQSQSYRTQHDETCF